MLKKSSVIDLDDLYLLLYTHWVFDDHTYDDEHQRVQVVIELLIVVFFECRSCFLFDTRVKLDEDWSKLNDDLLITHDQIYAKTELNDLNSNADKNLQSTRVASTAMIINSECKFDNDFNTACDDDSNNDFSIVWENDSDSDFCSIYNSDDEENDDTDDECNAESEKTRTFLYEHFIIIIVSHSIFEKPNIVFMKATLLHIKGEDNNSRM